MSTKETLEILQGYVPLFQTLILVVMVLLILLIFRKPIKALLEVITKRIDEGSSVNIGGVVEFGERGFVTKTADVLAMSVKQNEVSIFGNPDRFQLLIKAEADKWGRSTKAMEVPGGA